jgi:hypothetical protein
MRSLLPVLILMTLLVHLAAAQEAATAPGTRPQEAEEAGEEPANEVALVLAGTREREEKNTSVTIGAEYERRLTKRLAIVAELEFVNGPDSVVFAAPFAFRPTGSFKLFVGPGLERRPVGGEGEPTGGEEGLEHKGHENLFLWRMGTGYTWEFSERYVLGPTVYLDFIREAAEEWERAFVFGVSLGVAF